MLTGISTFIPITLTAFANAAGGTSAGTGASASVSGATATSQSTHSGSATGSATHSGNATSPTHSGAAIPVGGSHGKWSLGTAGLIGLVIMLQ